MSVLFGRIPSAQAGNRIPGETDIFTALRQSFKEKPGFL